MVLSRLRSCPDERIVNLITPFEHAEEEGKMADGVGAWRLLKEAEVPEGGDTEIPRLDKRFYAEKLGETRTRSSTSPGSTQCSLHSRVWMPLWLTTPS